MKKETVELLEIRDFLSITHIRWEVGRFNIITGDMGTGKSLCIKLLRFFEDIIPDLLVSPYNVFLEYLNCKKLFNYLIGNFKEFFVFKTSKSKSPPRFRIDYTFSYKEESFSMSITGKNKTDIVFESPSLEKLLAEWDVRVKEINPEKVTPDGFREAKLLLYNELSGKYSNFFPMSTIFVPASRAALAFASIHDDHYLNNYKRLVDVLPRYASNDDEMINTILKAKIKIKGTIISLESDDGREVPIANASSGQQEIVYVLLLLDKLGKFHYSYGKHHSLFIEEPSAHLFPLEQKQVIELIAKIYNYLKGNGNPLRVFITTHSPYILNSLSNMLKKGFLLEKYGGQEDRINEVDIPCLNADEVSAYFIDTDGTWDNMLDESKKHLNADKIAKISYDIDEISIKLSDLNNEFLSEDGN